LFFWKYFSLHLETENTGIECWRELLIGMETSKPIYPLFVGVTVKKDCTKRLGGSEASTATYL